MGNKPRKSGKYLNQPAKQKKSIRNSIQILVCVLAILIIVNAGLLRVVQNRSIYQTIVHDGYTGTQEQLLASLVGEEVESEAETAYAMAVKHGYTKSEEDWIETLVGIRVKNITASPYALACKNGYAGSFAEWLTQLADNPATLGWSNSESKTEYEIACEYGFEGSFIEWLITITSRTTTE